MTRWQAVVFDLDDTLYPERDYVLGGLAAVAHWVDETLGFAAPRTCREFQRLFDDGARGRIFNRWLLDHDLDPDPWVPTMVETYRNHRPRIRPYPGVRTLMESLRGKFRLGLVTDGYLEVQTRKLSALALADCFDAVVYSDALGRDAWKPDPRPFEAVLSALAVAAAVYVGDNPAKDFRGAREVGMATVRVRHPRGLYADLEPLSRADAPDVEISDLHALEPLLTGASGEDGACAGSVPPAGTNLRSVPGGLDPQLPIFSYRTVGLL